MNELEQYRKEKEDKRKQVQQFCYFLKKILGKFWFGFHWCRKDCSRHYTVMGMCIFDWEYKKERKKMIEMKKLSEAENKINKIMENKRKEDYDSWIRDGFDEFQDYINKFKQGEYSIETVIKALFSCVIRFIVRAKIDYFKTTIDIKTKSLARSIFKRKIIKLIEEDFSKILGI